MDPLLVIANAEAGGGERDALQQALEVLRAEADVEVARTSNPGELDGVLHRAGCRRLVVAGGDGSLHAVVKALYKRHELEKRTIGLLPLGTGNDFARSLGIPLDPQEAARTVLTGEVRPMDLIVDELGGVVVNNVHAGASAQASRRGARWKKRLGPFGIGILGYPVGAALAAFRPPYVRLRIEVDGEILVDVDRPTLMVAIGNGASVGGGTELTPDADPEDGRLDVMVSLATGPLQRFAYVGELVLGKHQERDDVLTARATQVTISGEDFYLSADGEINGPERRRSWHLERAAYSMVVPPA
ncbi:diacylglycerol/lipid kinase family protein [Nocardioides aurantiacus]|uniref:YegS/Rv2252/BmrU family lipid kinase n=1 Tax=Nocardioides aurantiacus TaxID=86796 RepID=A0A3N2CYP0_9ACTN|nr:diacylglycerol kinase family protein [Nocardioides aurantiacus]ROR92661.1 YegS/Rv2252/BmrU family lipid kinase [Nocardioides aurantiacus]